MKMELQTNIIYCGDCKEVLKKIPDESIDLIYLDPPFFSQKHYEDFWVHGKGDAETVVSFSDRDWEKLRQSIDKNILREYEHIEERWKGGHKGLYVYVAYMRERLVQCERVLKKTGSIYLHCDWHAGHYLKVMMDEIFGYENFRNDIIWHYRKWSAGWKQFQRNHDIILFYSKTDNKKRTFNKMYMERSESTLRRFGTSKIVSGFDKKTGRRVPSKMAKEDSEGVPMDDVWDIGRVPPVKQLYPTQKPEKLLQRIIEASSNKGDVILDPFCGCGTAIVVSKQLHRQFIGIDISRTACYVTKHRLGNDVKVLGGESPDDIAKMDPHEVARLVIVEKMEGIVSPRKSGDLGIDGWIEFKTIPVQVKRWQHKVGRPEIDKFKTAVERDKKKEGIMVAFEYSKDAYREAARIKKEDKLKLRLMIFEDIFDW